VSPVATLPAPPARWLALWLAALLLSWIPLPLRAADTNHNFARWEKDIRAFESAARTNPPPRDGILFIGSSTIARWKTLAQDYPGLPVINRGFGGSEIADSTHFADRIIFPYHPRMVLLRAGGNDLHAGKTPEQVFSDFKEFEQTVHAHLPECQVVFISLSPSVSRAGEAADTRRLNDLVRDYCAGRGRLSYLETYDISLDAAGKLRPELFVEDRLHFNAKGYALLADRVRPALTKQRPGI
jgi:lysophospholipase L1-like esterase